MKASGVFYGKKIKVFSDLGQGIVCQSIVIQSIVLNSCRMFMIGSIILFVRIHWPLSVVGRLADLCVAMSFPIEYMTWVFFIDMALVFILDTWFSCIR